MAGYPPGSVEAFYFDRALWLWGTRIEAEMDKAAARVKSKNKAMPAAARAQVLNSYIRPGDKSRGIFRDPALQMSKKKDDVQNGMVIGGFSG